jgi:chromosome segregation ATPase
VHAERAKLRAEQDGLDEHRNANAAARLELESETLALRDTADRIEAEREEIEAERTRLREMWEMVDTHRKQAAGFLSALEDETPDPTVIDLTESHDDSTI